MALKRKTDKSVSSSSILDGLEETQAQSVLEDDIESKPVEWEDGKIHFFLPHAASKGKSGSSIRLNGNVIFLTLEDGRVALDLPPGISSGQLIKSMEDMKFIHEPYNTDVKPPVQKSEREIDYWVIAHTDNMEGEGWEGIVEIDENNKVKFEKGIAKVSNIIIRDALLAKGFLEHSIQYKV